MDALTVHHVTKRYANHLALKDVSLSVPEQCIFGLLGPNGAGKTTLIRIINQIIEADEGTIEISGEKLSPRHIRHIGYLPEERGLYKKMKVGEQLVYLGQLRGLSRRHALDASKQWVKKLEIADWWNKKIEDLSKGMAQKIQFIATVLHKPELIILDEPFSGFDPVNANLIKDKILQLREQGSTIIFSTHRMESVEELCDHIALIDKAQKILDGTKKEIKHRYKSDTYHVEYRGTLNGALQGYEIGKVQKLEDNFSQSMIKITNGQTPNQLLEELIQRVEVHSFVEHIPSINEIFIKLVREKGHE